VQAIKNLPEIVEFNNTTVPSQTIISRENLLLSENDVNMDDQPLHDDEDEEFFKSVKVLPDRVFNNAAPFLRVKDPSAEDHKNHEDVFNIKDDMRVHPRDEKELTEIARVAVEASEDDETWDDPIPHASVSREKVHAFAALPKTLRDLVQSVTWISSSHARASMYCRALVAQFTSSQVLT
jgi:hypothetical protein